jgi:DNA-binding NtrC family response regulator
MPPLRERREDIPMLAQYFVSKSSAKCKLKPKQISPEAMSCLVHYDWPGNVRELENAMERALVLGSSDVMLPEDLPESVLEKDMPPGVVPAKYHAAVKELKKSLILTALEQAHGNYTEAARSLGLHANYLHRLIRNFELRDAVHPFPSARTATSRGSGGRR